MRFEKDKLEIRVLNVYGSTFSDNQDKETSYSFTEKKDLLAFTLEGIEGSRHFGHESLSGGRLGKMYEKGTRIRNNRQWSAISQHEIEELAKNLGINGTLTPELLGINLLLDGIDNISELPPISYIIFSPHRRFQHRRPEDVVLVVYSQMSPCAITGKALAKYFGNPSLKKRFSKEAFGWRGTTGWVERGGIIKQGYTGWILTTQGIE